MVASALGQAEDVRIVNVPLEDDTEAAYGIYEGGDLSKLVVLNLDAFNETTHGERPSRAYEFRIPGVKSARVQRLTAPGSDSTDNLLFGGVSYDYAVAGGRPVSLDEREEVVSVEGGVLSVEIPASEAVLYTFD